jgi:hypothetical protein
MQLFDKFKSLLKQHPEVLQRYVAVGTAAVKVSLVPITGFMKHLILIQDLDPNMEPGLKRHQEMVNGLNEHFNSLETKDYDDDYDFSWFHKKFQNTNSKLDGVSLSEDRYKRLTDLSKLIKDEGTSTLEVTLTKDPVVSVKSYTKPKKTTRKTGKYSKKVANKRSSKRGK